MIKKKKGMSAGSGAVIGAGLAAVGAGAYYFLGPKSKQHQKKAKVWIAKMEKEVKTEFKKAKNASMPVYNKTIDTLAKNYSKQYKEHEKEINALAKKLKGEWKKIKPKVDLVVKKAKKAVK